MTDLNLLREYPGLAAAGVEGMAAPAGCAAAAVARPDSIRVIVTHRLDDLRPYWPGVETPGAAQYHVFQCAELLDVWVDTLGRARGTTPCFVALLDDRDRPLLLFPLGIERDGGVRVLRFLDGGVSDYNVPVIFPEFGEPDAEAFRRLWQRILAALPPCDAIQLEKMPDCVGERRNPLLLLDPARESVSGHVRSRTATAAMRRTPHHASSRRKLKKLSEHGPVEWVKAETANAYAALLDVMIAQKQRRFEESRVPGFEVPGKRAFYQEATRRLAGLGAVHLTALKVGESVIATHWGLLLGDRLYQLMPGHAGGEWSRYSPGRLLNDFLAQWSDERGLSLDFGVGDEAFKNDYCDVTVPLYGLVLPVTPIGRVYLRYRAGLAWLRSTRPWQAVRPLKWVVRRAFR